MKIEIEDQLCSYALNSLRKYLIVKVGSVRLSRSASSKSHTVIQFILVIQQQAHRALPKNGRDVCHGELPLSEPAHGSAEHPAIQGPICYLGAVQHVNQFTPVPRPSLPQPAPACPGVRGEHGPGARPPGPMIHVATATRAGLRLLPCSPEMLICRRSSSRVHPLLETAVDRVEPPTCDRRIILGVACNSQRNCASLSKLPVSCSTVLSYPVPSCPCAA